MKNIVWKSAPKITNDADLQKTLLENRPQIKNALSAPSWTDNWWESFSDPFELSGMETACARIFTAIEKKERIIVFGDFDSDGITSTAILTQAIADLGGIVSYRIPDRSIDNHGLKYYLLDEIAEKKVSLVITCDCGINDFAEVAHAQSIGLDMIVTDHHSPNLDKFPTAAVAVINPKLDKNFSEQELSGSAVALKLVQALAEKKWPEKSEAANFWQNFIEISAIGVVADCVELVGENRLIVQLGLQKMAHTNWHGLKELLAADQNVTQNITAETIGFYIAPHLNAASRIGDRLLAAQLFLGNPDKSAKIIEALQTLNKKRKLLTKAGVELAVKQIDETQNCQIVFDSSWPAGILGLIASRVCELTGKPTIACSIKHDGTVGSSCRSIDGVSIIDALNEASVAPHLKYFGGHAGAAGFVCEQQNFESFKKSLQSFFQAQDFPAKTFTPDAWIDPAMIHDELLMYMDRLAPFGEKNPEPLFGIQSVFLTEKSMLGKSGEHFTFKGLFAGKPIDFLSFFTPDRIKNCKLNQKFSVLFHISVSYWQGKKQIKFRLVDVKEAAVV